MKYRIICSCLAVAAVATGCVTPPTIKDASTKHAENLNQLEKSAKTYRTQVAGDYERRIDLQKQAYIAQSLATKIDTMTEALVGAADTAHPTPEDKPSRDFLTFAAELREEYKFQGDKFDFWLGTKGDDIESKKAALRSQAKEIEQQLTKLRSDNAGGKSDPTIKEAERALKGLNTALASSPDTLAHVIAAIEFRKQKAARLAKIDLLLQQIGVMKSFHSVVDDYLAIDATIDAGAIAKAAAAGSKMDLSGLSDLQQAIGKK
jgi:hypothetical protein